MPESLRKVVAWFVPVAALTVIVVGLLPGSGPALDDAARAERVAANLRCPFCNGESIADSPSGVARDLRVIISDQVASGMSDREIYDYFAARYGERVLLSPPASGWGTVLWAGPLLAAATGVATIFGLRRRSRDLAPTIGNAATSGRRS